MTTDWTLVNSSPTSGSIRESHPVSMDVDSRGDLSTGSLRGWTPVEPPLSGKDVQLWPEGRAPSGSSRQKLLVSVVQPSTGKTVDLNCNQSDTLEGILKASRGALQCDSPSHALQISISVGEACSTPSSARKESSEQGSVAEIEAEPPAFYFRRKHQELLLAEYDCEKTVATLREHIKALDDRRFGIQAALKKLDPVIQRLDEEEQWEEEAQDLDGEIEPSRPVGLPNLGADCFWQATLQCLRHLDGFGDILRPALSKKQEGSEVVVATAKLLRAMRMAEDRSTQMKLAGTSARPSVRRPAIANFRTKASEALSQHAWTDQEPLLLPASDFYAQRQQDAHEFLSLFLDCLSSAPVPEDGPLSPRQQGPIDEDSMRNLRRLEEELTKAPRGNSQRLVEYRMSLFFEYSAVQWSLSTTRMRSTKLSTFFEGQRLSCIHCTQCQRFGVSAAEPFCIEDVKLNSQTGGLMSQMTQVAQNMSMGLFNPTSSSVSLKELLRTEMMAPEGFRCPNPACQAVGTSKYFSGYLRLPGVLVVHVNRAQVDESRCEAAVKFEENIDLKEYDLVRNFGDHALDRNFSPCPSKYQLQSAVFHRGPSARSGHYFAYVRWPKEGKKSPWVKVDDERVERPSGKAATPMGLELSEPADGARVALLFYQREDLLRPRRPSP